MALFLLAGCGESRGYSDGPYMQSTLSRQAELRPIALGIDADDNILLADPEHHVVRRVTLDGVSSLLAGTPGRAGARNGRALDALFTSPCAALAGPGGVTYVLEARRLHTLRIISADGMVMAQPVTMDDLTPEAVDVLQHGLGLVSAALLTDGSALVVLFNKPMPNKGLQAGHGSDDELTLVVRITLPDCQASVQYQLGSVPPYDDVLTGMCAGRGSMVCLTWQGPDYSTYAQMLDCATGQLQQPNDLSNGMACSVVCMEACGAAVALYAGHRGTDTGVGEMHLMVRRWPNFGVPLDGNNEEFGFMSGEALCAVPRSHLITNDYFIPGTTEEQRRSWEKLVCALTGRHTYKPLCPIVARRSSGQLVLHTIVPADGPGVSPAHRLFLLHMVLGGAAAQTEAATQPLAPATAAVPRAPTAPAPSLGRDLCRALHGPALQQEKDVAFKIIDRRASVAAGTSQQGGEGQQQEEVLLRAHRLLLCARSDYFRAMFGAEGTVEADTRVVTLRDVAPAAVAAVLHYLYTDEVQLQQGPPEEEEGKEAEPQQQQQTAGAAAAASAAATAEAEEEAAAAALERQRLLLLDVLELSRQWQLPALHEAVLASAMAAITAADAVSWLVAAHAGQFARLRRVALYWVAGAYWSELSAAQKDLLFQHAGLAREALDAAGPPGGPRAGA